MAPIAADTLIEIARWISPPRRVSRSPSRSTGLASSDLVPLNRPRAQPLETGERDWSRVSELGRVRWHCLEALSDFDRTGIAAMGRWNSLLERRTALRLELLDLDDRYRFLAWLIKLTNELDNVFIPKLASWLSKVGVTDADRIKSRWAEERVGLVVMSSDLNPARSKMWCTNSRRN